MEAEVRRHRRYPKALRTGGPVAGAPLTVLAFKSSESELVWGRVGCGGGWWTCGWGRFWYWVNRLFRRCGHIDCLARLATGSSVRDVCRGRGMWGVG